MRGQTIHYYKQNKTEFELFSTEDHALLSSESDLTGICYLLQIQAPLKGGNVQYA